ncbi:MAG TPA: hypothetical protein VFH63_01140 [candidate division Zixibacteria bacterium]|nr:hypothetical protein [candidate division Zixibacteria bacterium]
MAQLMEMRNVMRWGRWVLLTAALLAVPALAMALNVGDVEWGALDFAVAGVLLLAAGLLFEYAASRSMSIVQRLAIAIAVLAALGLMWINLAVGMMEVEAGNAMYLLVVLVGLVGTAIGRFEPREASMVLFATAATQVVVAVVGLATGLGPTLPADVAFVLAWGASGLLFRQASLETAPEA